MPARPEIFISSTTKDLKSCRQSVRDALLTLGCVPIVQDHFPPHARTVKEMLRERIAHCHAVVHLAGECYGYEPQERTATEPRRSYTQMEYDVARELRKPVYTFLCADGFPYDEHAPEDEERRALQRQHRAALAAGDHVYVPIRDTSDLEKSVRELQTRLEHVTRDLHRTRSWLAWGVAASLAILLVIGGLFYALKRHAAGIERELAEVRRELQQQSRTDLVNEKLDRLLAAVGDPRRGDPTATARAETARQLGISVDELQQELDGEHTDLKGLLARIDARGAAASRQTAQWDKLKRETLAKLGGNEMAAGHYAAAVEPYRQALALVDERNAPLDWCDAAQDLGNVLRQTGRYDEAETLTRKLVERRTALRGPDDPDTLRSVNRLASLLRAKGDYAAAEPLLRHALETQERTLGTEHPDTLTSVNSLANLLSAKGDYAAAEPLYRRCLEARERVLGREHPNTLRSVNNLANVLRAEGDSAAAEPLFRRCLEAQERTLGGEHPHTLLTINSLANLLGDKGDYAAAEGLFRRCLEAQERVIGRQHPDTATTAYHFSLLQEKQGKLDQALELAEKAVAMAKASLPENHPGRRSYEDHLREVQARIAARQPDA